jgi:hypothetical protein
MGNIGGGTVIASHIHDALRQVRQLRELVLDRRTFRGYSGAARIAGGVGALLGAAVLASPAVPRRPLPQLAGWGVVLALSLAANYGALARWFLSPRAGHRDVVRLMPAVDAIPVLAVGALLSVALVLRGQYDLLFGAWMCLYGLVHGLYRLSLPKANYAVGMFYLVCGAVCLLTPAGAFTNPWTMGLVFFVGEVAGGCVFCRLRLTDPDDGEQAGPIEEETNEEAG